MLFVFDLDDTLYKERDFVASGYHSVARYFAEKYGFNASEMFRVMTTAPLNPFDSLEEYIINRSVQQGIKVEEKISDMVDIYRNHFPEISLEEEVVDTLFKLKEQGNTLALITDGRAVTQQNKIDALGLTRFIAPSLMSISGNIGAEKYTPKPFERMMGLAPGYDRYIYIGDNPMKDFVWPNRLGWSTVQLNDNGRNVHSQSITLPSEDYLPQHSIDSFRALPDIIF